MEYLKYTRIIIDFLIYIFEFFFFKKRKQFVFFKVVDNYDDDFALKKIYFLQKKAIVANFLHSLDAFVMFYVLKHFNTDVVPIHDCWGISMSSPIYLQKFVKDSYNILGIGWIFQQSLIQFCKFVMTTESNTKVVLQLLSVFLNLCIHFNIRIVDGSRYMVYY